jgi:hypothetical protein
MKGLNVKRIAALGIGAALVGSALAPAVMAGVFNNVNSLQKSNIVNTTGTPVVDIVVGSMGQAADVVWAGNIAAKVAQLATVDATEGAATVDYTVGGTTSVAGAGEVVDAALVPGVEFSGINVTNTKMPSLVNNTSFKYKWGSTTQQTTSIQESLDGNMNVFAQMETGSSRYAPGQLLASVDAGDLAYTINIGASLPLAGLGASGLDSNSSYDLTIPILGKYYTLDGVEGTGSNTKLIFYANTTPTDLEVGQSVSVEGTGTYAGKTLTIQLVDLIQIGSGTSNYQAKWSLMDGTTNIKYVQKSNDSTYNLKDEFGDVFSDNVHVTAAGLNLSANKYTATIRTGDDRLEIKNNAGFPFTGTSTVDNKAEWKATFDTTNLTYITITNQWKYNKTIGSETDTTKYALKVGESIALPSDFAKFEFNGFEDKASSEVVLGNGKLQYKDLKGTQIEVPFMKQFDVESGKPIIVEVAGKDFTFWFDGANDFTYVEGDKSSAETQAALQAISGSETRVGDPEASNTVALDLGAKAYSGSTVLPVTYVVDVNYTTGTGFLLLAAQDFNITSKNRTDAVMSFKGTQLDNNDLTADVAYFSPNTTEYLRDVQGLTSSDKNYYAARFVFTNASEDTNLYIRADEMGNVWDYDALSDLDSTIYNKHGPTLDAQNAAWGSTAIRGGSDYLEAAATAYGTEIVSDGSVFTLTVPEEQRNVVAYLGSTDASEVVSGGSAQTGVAVGETKGNVTITGINGAAGKTVVSVGNIVKLDTDASSGKAIIVGGHMVNRVAATISVEGQTLKDRLVSDGDWVAAVLDNGSIVVAGWTANDTATAARELINKLESFL